ncbi:MAG: glycosyltransferase [Chitinophagaceae bacterium]|nr:MAG: glycosyltransferase [Chitinophagaceae bacterium]
MEQSNYLIYTTVTCWDEPPRARHQVAHELKKSGPVYFVEKNKTGRPRIEVREAEPNVFVITPYYWLDYRVRYRTPLVNENYHRWLLRSIRELGVRFELVVSFDYTAPGIHNYFDNVIFYCADDNVGFGKFNPFFVNRYHTSTERRVASNARLCVVTSDYMKEKIGRYNPQTYVVPLGAPLVDFEATPTERRAGTPVLGLVGYLDSNLDYELIESLLDEFIIHFIGPASPANRERLGRHPNARLLGPMTGNTLYRALQEVDCCIAPYDESKINKGATPNKLWLYLAMGKPVVVTNIPNIRNWDFGEGLVYKCRNEDFLVTCRQACAEDKPEKAQVRIDLARANSWEARIRTIRELYYSLKTPEPQARPIPSL